MYLSTFKRKKKKPNRLELVKNNTFKRIYSFRKHFSKKNREDNFIQFFHIVKLFFAELFKIRYEFTFEELNKELERKRIDENLKERITFFLKKVSVVEYSNETLSEQELKKLLSDFLKLFEKLTFNEEKVKETRLCKILRILKVKRISTHKKERVKKQNALLVLMQHISPKLKINLEKSRLEQIHNMLIKALDMLNNNEIQKSKQLYVKIKENYNHLKIENKKEIYDDILFLYKELVPNNKN